MTEKQNETGKEVLVQEETLPAHQGEARAIIITPRYVFQQQQSLQQMQRLTKEVLVDGRDYGRIPSLPGKALFDCGAQLIIGAFNCHVGHRKILSITDNPAQLSIIVEVPLVNFETGIEVATGIGAASILEPRSKYRWVENPGDWGYDEESAKELKHEERNNKIVYQILNPEPGECFNFIVKMASKRAEVDAAKNLPGAGSALKEILDIKFKATEDWDSFWGELKRMGLKPDELQAILGDKSVKEWQKKDKGNTLERAIKLCRTYVESKNKPTVSEEKATKDKSDLYGQQQHAAAQTAPLVEKPKQKSEWNPESAGLHIPDDGNMSQKTTQEPHSTVTVPPEVITTSSASASASGEKKASPAKPDDNALNDFWKWVNTEGWNPGKVNELIAMTVPQALQSGFWTIETIKAKIIEAKAIVKKGLEPK